MAVSVFFPMSSHRTVLLSLISFTVNQDVGWYGAIVLVGKHLLATDAEAASWRRRRRMYAIGMDAKRDINP
ncbi:hypothetical protein B296_00048718 [Ensete ventricosum]|uniref:Uncharacterized protein n=1 Tax=Ensete ventricosum TaxID=4639 RepID=A0A426Y0F0_ENSVE|nr:hypothetical protein B296_00048718 [Ensete ventricosum]